MLQRNFLAKIDILSIEPKLRYFGHSRFQTWFGGLVTIVSIITIGILSLYFSFEIFDRTSATIIYNQDATIHPVLNISEFPIMFSIQNAYAQSIPEQRRYWGIKAEFWRGYVKDVNGTLVNQIDIIPIKMKQCNIETDFAKYKNYFKDATYIPDHYCIVPEQNNLTLYGVYGDLKPQSFIVVSMYRCQNGYDNNTNCHDMDKIDKTLLNSFLSVRYIDFDIVHKNVDKPLNMYMRAEFLPISSSIYKRFFMNKKNIAYDTDYGFVFQDRKVENFHQQDLIDVSVDNRREKNPDRFAVMNIQMSRKTDLFNRSYPKLQNLIANIGGVVKGILLIANFFVTYLSQKYYDLNLVNKIFDYCELEKKNSINNNNISVSDSKILPSKVNNTNNNPNSQYNNFLQMESQ